MHLSTSHIAVILLLSRAGLAMAQQEAILQYFNAPWNEINGRIPEVAEAGYGALWLPPPTKGASGTYSVGYDPLDRFDLGDRNQSGGVRTRYGTKAELLALVEKAHRFGIRVYFDNISLSAWTNAGSEIAPAADHPDYSWIDLAPLPGRSYYRVSARVPGI